METFSTLKKLIDKAKYCKFCGKNTCQIKVNNLFDQDMNFSLNEKHLSIEISDIINYKKHDLTININNNRKLNCKLCKSYFCRTRNYSNYFKIVGTCEICNVYSIKSDNIYLSKYRFYHEEFTFTNESGTYHINNFFGICCRYQKLYAHKLKHVVGDIDPDIFLCRDKEKITNRIDTLINFS